MRYIAGNTVQGKRRTKSYKVHKVEAVPKEEWVIVEGTHEAIIDKETFYMAQELSKRDTKISQKTKELSIWAGFLRCIDCKMAMNKKSSINKIGKCYEYYVCSTYRKKSKYLCTKHTIKAEKLEKAVLRAINLHIELLINIDEFISSVNIKESKNIKKEENDLIINSKKKELVKLSNYKRNLYEDWKNGDITKEEYLEYKKKYENDIVRLENNLEKLRYEKNNNKEEIKNNNQWIQTLKEKHEIAELSRDIMVELIDCIYVHEDGNITIKFRFRDEFKDYT